MYEDDPLAESWSDAPRDPQIQASPHNPQIQAKII